MVRSSACDVVCHMTHSQAEPTIPFTMRLLYARLPHHLKDSGLAITRLHTLIEWCKDGITTAAAATGPRSGARYRSALFRPLLSCSRFFSSHPPCHSLCLFKSPCSTRLKPCQPHHVYHVPCLCSRPRFPCAGCHDANYRPTRH